MLRKFKIAIDGKQYLVEMEEIGGAPAPQSAPAPSAAVAVAEPEPKPAPAPEPVPSNADTKGAMTSPMPGTILRVLVSPGEAVKVNQPLVILEAMKMENEVVAEKDGQVAAIHVAVGQTVNAGDALITIS